MKNPVLNTLWLAVFAAGSAAAAPRLNDTGIAACIDGANQLISCGGTGQDAEFGRDLTHPADANGRLGFRFTQLCNSGEPVGQGTCPSAPTPGNGRNDWGCTRDEVTGLVWEVKTASGGKRDWRRNYTYYSPDYDPDGTYGGPKDVTGFVTAVNAAGLCGASDWRVPTPAELMGIVDMGQATLPAVDTRFFPNTITGAYWGAGTVYSGVLADQLAWVTDFSFGLGSISAQFRESARPLRLVRGGQAGGARFVVAHSGQEVSDRATGLVWRRCAEGQSFDGEACSGSALRLTWVDALKRAQQQANETGVAWRLPNQKELASLLDHEHRAHINRRAFPPGDPTDQWTSSPILVYRLPRCVSFVNGSTSFCNSGTALGLRLVRDRP